MAERSVNVKLSMDVAAYMAGARAAGTATRDLEKAARDVRKAHDEEADAAGRVRVAESKLTELRADAKTKVSALSAAEEQLSKAHRSLEVAQGRTTAATERFAKAQKDAGEAAEKGSKKVDDSMSRMASRSNAQFDAMKFTALSVGLPAAAAVGAAGVALSLAVIAGGFAAVGVYGVSSSDRVRSAVSTLSTSVQSDVKAMSTPLEGEVLAAIGGVGEAWTRLKPQVATATQASTYAVRELSGAATDLAENAMPGLITAVKASEPALKGVRTFAGEAGAGLGEFAANASAGAENAGRGIATLGGTVRTVEARFGSLFANLANGSAGPLRSLDTIVDQVTGGLLDFTSAGGGGMGVLQGFSTAGSGAATVLHGVLAAVSALPPQVTQFAGSFGAASMIASKFGLDAGKGFEGLGAKIGAATGPTDKLKVGIGGLVSGALNPAFLAVTALGVGLDILGTASEKASARASAHAENVRAGTDALRKDNGVVGEHVRSWNVEALTTKNATANLASYGGTMQDAKLAIEGNIDARDRLNVSANSTIDRIGKEAGLTTDQIGKIQGLSEGLLKNGGDYALVKSDMDNYTTSMNAQGQTVDKLSASQRTALDQLMNAQGAVGEQIKSQQAAHDAYVLSEQALTGLSAAQIAARDATVEHTQAIFDQQNANLGYRGSLLGVKDAEDAYQKTLKDGKATSEDKAKALLNVERAFAAQEQAAYQAAYAMSKAESPEGKQADAMKALNAEAVKLANTFKGKIPESLAQTIGSMTPLEAKAAGLVTGINKVGDAVYRLPDGREIKITPTTAEAQKALEDFRAGEDGKAITSKFFTDTGPATGQVKDWDNTTRTIQGNTTTYTHIDPATHEVGVWKTVTDATGATTTTFADVDPATGKVRVWKQNTDGTYAEVTATANADPAYRAIQDVALKAYRATITVGVNYRESIRVPGTNISMNAKGNLYSPNNVGFASGGFPTPTSSNSFNGMAQVVRPGDYKWAGDANVPEVFAPLNGSARTRKLLIAAARHEKILGDSVGMANGGLVDAAKEMLAQVSSGGQLFEDFSYYGNSPTVSSNNDALSELFYQSQGSGFNFDGSERTRSTISSWLEGYIGQQSQASAVQQTLTSGAAVQQTPKFSAPAASGAGGGGATEVRVFIGDREITNIVRTEIRQSNRQTRRSVGSRAGG